jgi:hypothetical protein
MGVYNLFAGFAPDPTLHENWCKPLDNNSIMRLTRSTRIALKCGCSFMRKIPVMLTSCPIYDLYLDQGNHQGRIEHLLLGGLMPNTIKNLLDLDSWYNNSIIVFYR